VPKTVDLWTHCFTPTELTQLVEATGLRLDAVWSVEPGAYQVVLDKNTTTPYAVDLTAPFTITG